MNDEHPDVTMRQRQLVENVLSGDYGTIEAAAVAAKYEKKSARHSGSKALKLPHVVAYMDHREQQLLAEAEQAALVMSGQSDKTTPPAADTGRPWDELKQRKMELEVASLEAKLRQLEPDDDAGELERLRRAWIETVEHAYHLGVDACALHGAEVARKRTVDVANAVEDWAAAKAAEDDADGDKAATYQPFNARELAVRTGGDE